MGTGDHWVCGLLAGLLGIGHAAPESDGRCLARHGPLQACLDRLGITGVTLMALLSGFASVSSIWQTFGPKAKPVMDTDISRKQTGIDATMDIIAEKKAGFAVWRGSFPLYRARVSGPRRWDHFGAIQTYRKSKRLRWRSQGLRRWPLHWTLR